MCGIFVEKIYNMLTKNIKVDIQQQQTVTTIEYRLFGIIIMRKVLELPKTEQELIYNF